MIPPGVIVIVLIILVLLYGYSQGWFDSSLVPSTGAAGSGTGTGSGTGSGTGTGGGTGTGSGTAPPASTIKPRQSPLVDCGYGGMTRGWYDVQNQGARNDFCRYVGDGGNPAFSCQMAGSTDGYGPGANATAPGYQAIDPDTPHDEIAYADCPN